MILGDGGVPYFGCEGEGLGEGGGDDVGGGGDDDDGGGDDMMEGEEDEVAGDGGVSGDAKAESEAKQLE